MSEHSSQQDPLAIAAIATSFAFLALPLLYYRISNYMVKKNIVNPLAKIIATQGGQIKPPFPQPVRDMLSKCNLAYLSTIDCNDSSSQLSSHLSLMRFTYVNDTDDGEVVIMSTNKETKKFEMLQRQKGVALLVHDFYGGSGDGSEGQYSITLNGECRIVTDPEKADVYRQAHLKKNPDYPQFIVGDKIAILCVDVKCARICNINDRVVKWDVNDNSERSAGKTEVKAKATVSRV
jgi:general stress protein 26